MGHYYISTCVRIFRYGFCICVRGFIRGLTNSRRTDTHKSFFFEAGKNKAWFSIGTFQIFGSNCSVLTPLSSHTIRSVMKNFNKIFLKYLYNFFFLVFSKFIIKLRKLTIYLFQK